jgi:hypothetical protein
MRRLTKGDRKEEVRGPMPAPKDGDGTTLEPSFEGVDSDKGISRLEMMGLLGSGLVGTALGFSTNINEAVAKETAAKSGDAGEITISPTNNTRGIVGQRASLDFARAGWLWSRDPSGTRAQQSQIAIPTRDVVFLIALAKYQRFSDPGHAKAFVRRSCSRVSPDQVLCGLEDNPDLATSADFIQNCTSITFEVEVNNAFGYGVWVVLYL